MFINFTNHLSAKWSQAQLKAAEEYGEILDFPFPNVNPNGNEQYIEELAEEFAEKIIAHNPAAVLCQGEMTLSFAVTKILTEKYNVKVLAACSERIVSEEIGLNGETVRKIEFGFVRFRRYFSG
ncbi:MAG: hypothetical protein LBS21_15920 [Clostridiales bacterium]|jgi:hypothetical protein|nr:hypothetical protein [Clostridiales bacterium]